MTRNSLAIQLTLCERYTVIYCESYKNNVNSKIFFYYWYNWKHVFLMKEKEKKIVFDYDDASLDNLFVYSNNKISFSV